jgi:flagellar basal body rod protein FlgC
MFIVARGTFRIVPVLATVLVIPLYAQSSDRLSLEDRRSWVVKQPRSFDNQVYFTRRGGDIVRSERFHEVSGMFGDFDGDEDIDQYDYVAMQICLSFSGPGATTPTACSVFDSDGDQDIDLVDSSSFLVLFTGTLRGVLVEAGELVPIATIAGPYYSGEPGTWGNNALNGIARQAGYTQDDLWYEWSIESQPVGSGQVIIANTAQPATAYTILTPVGAGFYVFSLEVTNLVTLEFGTDAAILHILCRFDSHCNVGLFCKTSRFCDPDNPDADASGCVGLGNPCVNPTPICDEIADTCNACTFNAECNQWVGVDNIDCSTTTCSGATGACANVPVDAECEDGLFCTLNDFCSPEHNRADATGCVHMGNPCDATSVCNETTDQCETCDRDADCKDGFSCSVDACQLLTGTCLFKTIDAACHDGLFCNGEEGVGSCDPTNPGNPCGGTTPVCNEARNDCDACGSDADCNDGFSCTADNCEGSGVCSHTPNDANCPTGEMCTAGGCVTP